MFLFNNEKFRYKNNIYIFKIKNDDNNCEKQCCFGNCKNGCFVLCTTSFYISQIISCISATTLDIGYFKKVQ